jgi:hypothetical protein
LIKAAAGAPLLGLFGRMSAAPAARRVVLSPPFPLRAPRPPFVRPAKIRIRLLCDVEGLRIGLAQAEQHCLKVAGQIIRQQDERAFAKTQDLRPKS